jgi:hypothetical protein
VAGEDVVEAMGLLGDHDGHAQGLVGAVQAPLDAAGFGDGGEAGGEAVEGKVKAVEFPFHAGEEDAFGGVDVLVEGDDVAVVFGDERREGGDDAALVGAADEQDGGGLGVAMADPAEGSVVWGKTGGRRADRSGADSGSRVRGRRRWRRAAGGRWRFAGPGRAHDVGFVEPDFVEHAGVDEEVVGALVVVVVGAEGPGVAGGIGGAQVEEDGLVPGRCGFRAGRGRRGSLKSPTTSRLTAGIVLEGGADVVAEQAGLVAAHFGLAVFMEHLGLEVGDEEAEAVGGGDFDVEFDEAALHGELGGADGVEVVGARLARDDGIAREDGEVDVWGSRRRYSS